MRVAIALAAAAIVASSTGAMAGKKITFDNQVGSPTGCGMSITVSDVTILPTDPKSLAAATPLGNCENGVAIGGIGKGTVAGQTGQFLVLGINVNKAKNVNHLYVIQYPLVSGGIWASFGTTDGKTVEGPTAFGIYSLGTPPALRGTAEADED